MLCSQLEKIDALFRRQLGIPLLGKRRTWRGGVDRRRYGHPGVSRDYSFGTEAAIGAAAAELACS